MGKVSFSKFKNSGLKTFFENEVIKQVISKIYHPQSNKAVEANFIIIMFIDQ